ncbi:MAG TPA: 2-oxoacid:ferredoxin oxidoreductase subunit beta [Dehalococcoidia bacterium]|nr:2-oxoacid:ferredoxin oxidoreductase subunit beta [Dehalococcoidia bacterium]
MAQAQTPSSETPDSPGLSRKDFVSDQEVRWCPGCGDYSVLSQMQKTLPDLGVPRENIVFISGIGCSSRFPYYVETYGFHSIHGRALTLATGLKTARPELKIFVVMGDGDGLSIGGNHLLHAMRRNLDITVVLFNNRIYGLTKGQYSPTSEFGKTTKSSPMGTAEHPLNPARVALASRATFVARALDRDTKHLELMLREAAAHHGTSFVEVFQNCNIFNDGAFDAFADRDVRQEHTTRLENGQPIRFGKNLEHGVRLDGLTLEVMENAESDEGLLVHDSSRQDPTLAYMLAGMDYPAYPVPLGVLRQVDAPVYEDIIEQQIKAAKESNPADFDALLRSGETWVVS